MDDAFCSKGVVTITVPTECVQEATGGREKRLSDQGGFSLMEDGAGNVNLGITSIDVLLKAMRMDESFPG